MSARERQAFHDALDSVRQEIVDAVRSWRGQGRADDDLVLHVNLLRPDQPKVAAMTREQLELTIQDFDPSLPIELARKVPRSVPAVVDIHDYVRKVLWIDLTPPYSW